LALGARQRRQRRQRRRTIHVEEPVGPSRELVGILEEAVSVQLTQRLGHRVERAGRQ
jgi:hypothetical protein